MKRGLAEQIKPLQFPKQRIDGCRVGNIVEINEKGEVLVDFPGNMYGPLAARLTGTLMAKGLQQSGETGCDLLLTFANGDPEQPIIIDTLHTHLEPPVQPEPLLLQGEETVHDVTVDGQRITFKAGEEMVLQCGKASITLTRAGKILIRGAYLLTRSSGVNRIKGASVQIN